MEFMMNNPIGYKASKINDPKIVNWLKSIGKFARLATFEEDTQKKFDIYIDSSILGKMKVDTKYTTRTKDKLFFECKKHEVSGKSEATHIWYILPNRQYTYLIDRFALCRLAEDGRNKYIINADSLVDFSISELDKDDYFIIDMRKVL